MSVDERKLLERTARHAAAVGDAPLMQACLDAGLDGTGCLGLARRHGHGEVVRVLRLAGVEADEDDVMEPQERPRGWLGVLRRLAERLETERRVGWSGCAA